MLVKNESVTEIVPALTNFLQSNGLRLKSGCKSTDKHVCFLFDAVDEAQMKASSFLFASAVNGRARELQALIRLFKTAS